MSKRVSRCAYCGRRVRRAHHANVSVRERESGLKRRYHGGFVDCLWAAAEYMNECPWSALTICYYHEPGCSARQQFACAYFAGEPGTQLEEGDRAA